MMDRTAQTRLAMLAGATLALVLASGCRMGPKYQKPAPPAISASSYKGNTLNAEDASGWKPANPSDAMLRGKW